MTTRLSSNAALLGFTVWSHLVRTARLAVRNATLVAAYLCLGTALWIGVPQSAGRTVLTAASFSLLASALALGFAHMLSTALRAMNAPGESWQWKARIFPTPELVATELKPPPPPRRTRPRAADLVDTARPHVPADGRPRARTATPGGTPLQGIERPFVTQLREGVPGFGRNTGREPITTTPRLPRL